MDAKQLSIEDVHIQSVENATNIALIQQSLSSLQGTVGNLASTVDDYIKADLASKRPNWGIWIGVGSLMVLMFSGAWMVLTLKINAEIHPQSEKIAAIEQSVEMMSREAVMNRDKLSILTGQAQNSVDDRSVLNKKVDILQDKYTALFSAENAHNSERVSHEVEIETQFDADSQLRNTQFAEQQRINSVLWCQHEKTLGKYPSGPFYFPNISKRGSVTTGNNAK